ncbi:MAG: hypothetical protein GQ540_00140 [Lutibacter sp.]|uniref:hypothetical protein n=1 Tax=Lutibacter sp. TaxID=1925666 RepID=UPI001A09BD33|nr:hypothetical protein [Lutibacter sp.]NOR26918.1 hypothetical protein [Lutibacter sp.]
MKTIYKIVLIIFLIPLTITATDKKGKYTKSKTINKEYKVSKDATLNVNNKYGNITIASWNENKIVIDITITTNGNDEDKVEKRLKQIDVEFEASSSNVSAKTIIEKNSSNWNLWGKNNNVNMQIDYIIKIPVTNNVDLNNDYGAISLDKLEGTSKINCDYGKLTIGELLNANNHINIDYTNKSTIDFMKDGEINADYSTLHVEKSGKIKLNADYSHISFGKLESLNYNCDYGDLKIENCESLIGNSDYMHTTVGKLREMGDLNADYGSIKIKELDTNFKSIKLTSSYTNVKFGVSSSASFNITASINYGEFKFDEGFTFTKEIKKSTSKKYEGYFNSSNSNSSIILKTSYGNVTFNSY